MMAHRVTLTSPSSKSPGVRTASDHRPSCPRPSHRVHVPARPPRVHHRTTV
ncbi:hypothetical protein DENSPDRAFT_801860 [Dentipellis sp. KUC8613]|nr:hypothetical protein DENSPDRAFT_801860 [Dentipellis sp. KUC8613]